MEAICSSETSLDFQRITRRYIREASLYYRNTSIDLHTSSRRGQKFCLMQKLGVEHLARVQLKLPVLPYWTLLHSVFSAKITIFKINLDYIPVIYTFRDEILDNKNCSLVGQKKYEFERIFFNRWCTDVTMPIGNFDYEGCKWMNFRNWFTI
jgi:hypothetical protein